MAITCSFCGTEIKENETACSLCGTAVENTSAPVVEEVKPEPAAEAESIVAAEEVKGETDAAPVWICTQCGKEFDSATKFCGECGGKVTEKNPVEEIVPVWICTKCGKEFDAATKFCGECGGKVTEKNPVEEIAPVWICTKCGKEFDAATKFCGECGGKVNEKNCQEKIDWQTEIKKHRSYQPEKALELLRDWISKENKTTAVIDAYNLAVRLGKIEEGQRYLAMLCELAERDDADALYAFICNSNLKGYKYEYFLEKTEHLANQGNVKAIDAMRQHCFWYDDEESADKWAAKLPEDYKSAEWQSATIDDLQTDAQAGDLDAIESLADIYENEEEDYEEAAKWYKKIIPAKKKLAQAGDAQAMEWLFDNFRDGTRGLKEDEEQEMLWYNKWEAHLRKITQAGLPVHLWAMHKDIQKIRYKQNPSKYYAREIASAEEFDNNSAEAAKWYKKAGISATSEKLSVEKGESCSISEPVFGDAEKYRTILADLHDGSMYYVTSFDEKKLNAAMEFYGKELVRNEQDILIHRDLSIFGKTAGYILTEYGIAYTKSKGLFKGWEPRVILFDKNTEMIVNDKEREGFDYWYVTLNGEEVLDCFDQSCGKVDPKDELLVNVLQEIIEKNKQNSGFSKAGNIVEQYRRKLQQLHNGDYYFVSSFDEKRLTSAMKTYGCNLVKSEKDIIVWHDSSSRCTGKEGFILTNYGFVWHRDGYKEAYLFDKSTRFTINEDDDGIYFGFNLRRGELGCWCFEKKNGKISRNENLLLDTISEIVDSYKN